jgi:hypothetical protein
MNNHKESYPDRIRKIALDITLIQHLMELNMQAERLLELADELETLLKTTTPR